MQFRPLTPSKEVLEQVRLNWAQGMIIDHEGFHVTPSSPVLDPGHYEYKLALPSKCCYNGILIASDAASYADGCTGFV